MGNKTQLLHRVGEEELRERPEKFFMRDRCGMFICTEGSVRILFFNKSYEITPGGLALFHPFVKIVFKDISNTLKGYLGELDLARALPIINQVLGVENIEAIKSEPVVQIKNGEFNKLVTKVEEYIDESDALKREMTAIKQCELICKALLKSRNETLMLDVLNTYFLTKSKSLSHPTSHDLIFQKFMMDLQQNYMNHRDTMFYARRSTLSPKYFSTVVRNVSGAAPLEWIIQTVISVAQNYLTDTTMTIKEIAAALGFTSQPIFCKYFKRYTTQSPKEYRLSHK